MRRRRLLIYMDRTSGEWLIVPNCVNATLEQVKGLSARQVLAALKPGMVDCITPGKTYHHPDRQGLLRDLQWYASQLLKADWYWRNKEA